MFVTAIVAAGGRGSRFGAERPKQLISIGGRPILERSVEAFVRHPAVNEIIVALPPELVADPPEYLRPTDSPRPLRLVAGGVRRQDSVANALGASSAASDVIVIHDAARPFVSADLITRTIAAAATHGAAVAAIASRDTVKRAHGAAEAGQYVMETLARETIFLAQTPQAFRRAVLAEALAVAERDRLDVTDECTLAERIGQRVQIVDGDASNIKITTPEDLAIGEAIAARSRSAIKPARTGRAGTGYDLHRLVEGRPLVIGGVTIPSSRGALGHSDADVVCHAITDAVLGAAALGDIGRHFPDSDPRWKDASSLDLLARAVALVAERGLAVGNVDVTVILETPKIKDYIAAMRAAIARVLEVDIDRVSIKGKTNEGVDAIGRGEAIAAHAIALVRSR